MHFLVRRISKTSAAERLANASMLIGIVGFPLLAVLAIHLSQIA